MNKDTLISALLATYEAHKELVPLLDEDFAEDHKGFWVQYRGGWSIANTLKVKDRAFMLPAVRVWGEYEPEYVKKDRERHEAFCAEIDSLPRFSLITTWEQRAIRTATRRAEQLLAAQ